MFRATCDQILINVPVAILVLRCAGVEYGSRNVLADPEVREGIKQFTHWPTIPQVCSVGLWVGSWVRDWAGACVFESILPVCLGPSQLLCPAISRRVRGQACVTDLAPLFLTPPQVFIKGEFVGGRCAAVGSVGRIASWQQLAC